MLSLPDPLASRKAAYPIDPIFLKRWSPRAMSAEPITRHELMTLLEAARWAPSTYNEQEWRFLYALRDTGNWQKFFNLLLPANQTWCVKAAALMVVVSHTVFTRNNSPNPVHTFDTGAAFENLCLQGAQLGLVVHGMAGFDYDRARRTLNVPTDYKVEAMVAIGRPGDVDELPAELRSREKPTDRKPISEISHEGSFWA